MNSCNLFLLCSSSAANKHGKSGITCWTHREALSREDLHKYKITSRKIILGHLSPRKSMALSTFLFGFPPNALPMPPDTTTAATSAAGIFRDSTKPRALWPKDGPTWVDDLGNILLGPLPFISLIIIHMLSYRCHQLSSWMSTSFVTCWLELHGFLKIVKWTSINQKLKHGMKTSDGKNYIDMGPQNSISNLLIYIQWAYSKLNMKSKESWKWQYFIKVWLWGFAYCIKSTQYSIYASTVHYNHDVDNGKQDIAISGTLSAWKYVGQ